MLRLPTLAALLFLCSHLFGQNGDNIFDTSFVHEIRVSSSDPEFWQKLLADYDSTVFAEDNIYRPAGLIIDGTDLGTVGFRIKGFTSAMMHPNKKPFRIDFNAFVKGKEYDGIKKLSLNNGAADPSMMRDVLAFDVLRHAGVPASRTSYARVYLNDVYWGLYILVEQVDKEFAKSRFGNGSGNMFKCTNAYDLRYLGENKNEYRSYMSLKTNEEQDDWSGFINFVKYINHEGITENEFFTTFPEMFDISSFFKTLAVDVLLLNWDSYMDHGRNWYLYENTDANTFHWIPWDYNFSFSDLHMDVLADTPKFMATPKPLIRNLLKDDDYKIKLATAYRKILSQSFTTERLFPLIDFYEQQIQHDLEMDNNRDFRMETFHECLDRDIVEHHEETFKLEFPVDQVFIFDGVTPIPDSVLNSGMIILDTTFAERVEFETIVIDNLPVDVIQVYFFNVWDSRVIGMKPFISRRIHQVEEELKRLNLWVTSVDNEPETLAVYPNPANDFLNVKAPFDLTRADIAVISNSGQQVNAAFHGTGIDVSSLPSGLYMLKIIASGKTHYHRFSKE